jgi:hypothetical protein
VDLHQEATLRPRVRGERGVVGDGYGESEAVMVVDAVPVDSLEALEEAVDLLGQDHRPGVREGGDGLVRPRPDLHPAPGTFGGCPGLAQMSAISATPTARGAG